jgi:hypothetical protein
MCGIVVSISEDAFSSFAPNDWLQELCTANAKRGSPPLSHSFGDFTNKNTLGPDAQGTVTRIVSTKDARSFVVSFTASVLHLRGDRIIKQPHENVLGDVLCWNGEVSAYLWYLDDTMKSPG